MNLQPPFIREEIMKATRQFFFEQDFHEVLTPTLNNALPVEPNIYHFKTQWDTRAGNRDLYLTTSPESGLKKMIARGIGNCFAFGKSYRNLQGSGSLHIPEFLMLEWYREDATYEKIMDDVQQLLIHQKKAVDSFLHRPYDPRVVYKNMTAHLQDKWQVFSMVDLFKRYAGLDFHYILTDNGLFKAAKRKGYSVEDATWSALFDQIFVNEIESELPKDPFFIIDFPARLSPLCKVQKDKTYLADRFEFFMFGMELANGNNENTDYRSVEKIFTAEQQDRESKGIVTAPVDQEFVAALKTMDETGKSYAGIGMGIDRVAMIFAGVDSIMDVELLHP